MAGSFAALGGSLLKHTVANNHFRGNDDSEDADAQLTARRYVDGNMCLILWSITLIKTYWQTKFP